MLVLIFAIMVALTLQFSRTEAELDKALLKRARNAAKPISCWTG
jgi:hypothetical protein